MNYLKKIILKQIRRIKPARKLTAFFTLASFLAMSFMPFSRVEANPLFPDILVGERFNPNSLEETYNQAWGFRDMNSWTEFVNVQLGVLRADWETRIDAQITEQLMNATQSDAFLANPAYKDYLEKELLSRKQDLLEDWELEAEISIQTEKGDFLKMVSSYLLRTEESNSQTKRSQAEESARIKAENLQQRFLDAKEQWRTDFNSSFTSGLNNFGTSLATLQAEFNNFNSQLDASEKQFLDRLKVIDDYKATIKTAITQSVNGLESFLNSADNNELFRPSGTLNTIGQTLSNLITNLRTSLNNTDPDYSNILTDLSQTVTTYMSTQSNYANTQYTTYRDKQYQLQSLGQSSKVGSDNIWTLAEVESYGNNGLNVSNVYFSGTGAQKDKNLINYIKTKNEAALRTYLSSTLTGGLELENIHSYNLIAYTNSRQYGQPLIARVRTLTDGVQTDIVPVKRYSTHGDGFSSYKDTGGYCIALSELACWNTDYYFNQQTVNAQVVFSVKDKQAVTNTNTWSNISQQLSAEFSKWNDTILPAITNWEAQARNYKQFYDQWKVNADTLRAQAQENYDSSVVRINSDKEAWVRQMEESERDTQKRWLELERKIAKGNISESEVTSLLANTKPSSSPQASTLSVESIQSSFTNLKETKFTTSIAQQTTTNSGSSNGGGFAVGTIGGGISSALGFGTSIKVPENTQSYSIFNPVFSAPDFSLVERLDLAKQLQRGLTGAQQFAYLEGTNNSLDRKQEEANRSLINMYAYKVKDSMYAKDKDGKLIEDKVNGGYVMNLTQEQKNLMNSGECYKDPSKCSSFMEKNTAYTSIEIVNNQLILKKNISDGVASKDDGKSNNMPTSQGYRSGSQEQVTVINISQISQVNLPTNKGIFDEWEDSDYTSIDRAAFTNTNSFFNNRSSDMTRVSTAVQRASEVESYYTDLFYADANKKAQDEQMLMELAKAYLTGGAAGIKNFVTNQVKSKVAESIAEATGLPSGLISALLGGAKPMDALKSYAKQVATQKIAEATGLPAELIGQLMAKANAPKPKMTDSPAFKVFDTLATVVAVVAAPFTAGASLVALGAYKAAVAVVKAAENGGLNNIKSAVANIGGAMINGVVSGATGGLVDANISYSEENGFGAQVGVELGGVANVGLSYSEGEGFGAYATAEFGGIANVGLTYTQNSGFEAQASLGIEGAGSISANYNQAEGVTASANLGGEYGNMNLNYSAQNGVTMEANIAGVGTVNAGYSPSGGFTAQATVNVGGVDLNAGYSPNGGFTAQASVIVGGVSMGAGYSSNGGFAAQASISDGNGNSANIGVSNSGVTANLATTDGNGNTASVGVSNSGVTANITSTDANGNTVTTGYSSSSGFTAGASFTNPNGGTVNAGYSTNGGFTGSASYPTGNGNSVSAGYSQATGVTAGASFTNPNGGTVNAGYSTNGGFTGSASYPTGNGNSVSVGYSQATGVTAGASFTNPNGGTVNAGYSTNGGFTGSASYPIGNGNSVSAGYSQATGVTAGASFTNPNGGTVNAGYSTNGGFTGSASYLTGNGNSVSAGYSQATGITGSATTSYGTVGANSSGISIQPSFTTSQALGTLGNVLGIPSNLTSLTPQGALTAASNVLGIPANLTNLTPQTLLSTASNALGVPTLEQVTTNLTNQAQNSLSQAITNPSLPTVTELTTDSILSGLGLSPTNLTSQLSATLASIVPPQIQGAIDFVAENGAETAAAAAMAASAAMIALQGRRREDEEEDQRTGDSGQGNGYDVSGDDTVSQDDSVEGHELTFADGLEGQEEDRDQGLEASEEESQDDSTGSVVTHRQGVKPFVGESADETTTPDEEPLSELDLKALSDAFKSRTGSLSATMKRLSEENPKKANNLQKEAVRLVLEKADRLAKTNVDAAIKSIEDALSKEPYNATSRAAMHGKLDELRGEDGHLDTDEVIEETGSSDSRFDFETLTEDELAKAIVDGLKPEEIISDDIEPIKSEDGNFYKLPNGRLLNAELVETKLKSLKNSENSFTQVGTRQVKVGNPISDFFESVYNLFKGKGYNSNEELLDKKFENYNGFRPKELEQLLDKVSNQDSDFKQFSYPMFTTINQLIKDVKIEVDSKAKLTIIKNKDIAKLFSSSNETDLVNIFCYMTSMRTLLDSHLDQMKLPKPSLREFIINAINDRGLIKDNHGKLENTDPTQILKRYIEDNGYEVIRSSAPFPPEKSNEIRNKKIVDDFLKSDQKLLSFHTNGHSWLLARTPIDPNDPSKGDKAVIVDPHFAEDNGLEWNDSSAHNRYRTRNATTFMIAPTRTKK
ncbi:MAG: TIGR04388 family protein [Leptospiraceae bacterium]|nr:TIGR04388 family protein [Leptospiraceae bacterium]